MFEHSRVAVVGCGAFGAMIALRLSENGYDVTIFERESECFRGASFNNQNRLHLGFHYPRDPVTAKQCIQGFARFCAEFPECIVSGFPNLYFIAVEGSYTDKEAFKDFCLELDLKHELIAKENLPVEVFNVSQATRCEEVIYDCNILRSLILQRLDESGVLLKTDTHINQIKRHSEGYTLSSVTENFGSFEHVVNCSYSDINQLTKQLGHAVDTVQYEYTWIPIVKVNIERIGITVMDGPFMTLLPFGNSDTFLMYHVDHSVVARDDAAIIDPGWLVKERSPLSKVDVHERFKEMREACSHFVPALADATMSGFLQGPRMVMAKSDDTDTRPSVIRSYQGDYHTVFSGKIDHCVWVADEILASIISNNNESK